MLLAGILATWVNPLWVTPTPWSDAGFTDYKPIHKHPRTGKAGLIRTFDWDAVLLGSSRIDIAFDPTHPAFGDLRVANLALRGGTLCEHEVMLEYAVKNEPIQLAIIGIDLADMTSPINIPVGAGFDESPLGTVGDPFEKELRYIFGYSTLEMSIKSLNYRAKDRLSAYTDHGHWIRNLDRRPLRVVLQHDSFMWANRFIEQRRRSIDINPKKVESLRNIIKLCQEKNIRLILCLPPNHAAYLSVFRLKNDVDPGFSIDRELITRIIDEETSEAGTSSIHLWDFNDFHPYNCESLPPLDDPRKPLEMWADGTHALPSLGSIMVSRIMGFPIDNAKANSYGMELTTDLLDERQKQLKEGFDRYAKDHPEDLQWVREHMDQWEKSDD